MLSGDLLLGALLALDLALFASLFYAILSRSRGLPDPTDLGQAFGSLELALVESMPDLPSGFTWEEAVARLRSSGVQTQSMEGALRSYEAYRYGGAPLPDTDYREVVRLARALGGAPRGRREGGAPLGR